MLFWRRGILLLHDIHPKARAVLSGIGAFTEKGGLSMMGCGEV